MSGANIVSSWLITSDASLSLSSIGQHPATLFSLLASEIYSFLAVITLKEIDGVLSMILQENTFSLYLLSSSFKVHTCSEPE